MARRNFRRRSKRAGSIVTDVAHIGAKLSPRAAVLLGAFLFCLFYWAVPAYLSSLASNTEAGHLKPLLEVFTGRRVRLFHWLGASCAIVCFYFAVRNHYIAQGANFDERFISSFIAKLLGRNFD